MFHPPIIVMTSNDEREFSEAFKRRCIILDCTMHQETELWEIVKGHFFPNNDVEHNDKISNLKEKFEQLMNEKQTWPTDKILQAMYLLANENQNPDIKRIVETLKR